MNITNNFLPFVLIILSVFVTCVGFSQASDNIALGKPYTMSPKPNYSYCTDEGDAVQLTDGVYTEGYFWTQLSTVGWRSPPRFVAITLDLKEVFPIAGIALNSAAGTANVT